MQIIIVLIANARDALKKSIDEASIMKCSIPKLKQLPAPSGLISNNRKNHGLIKR